MSQKVANLGLCNTCKGRVPAEFVIRDNEVWIRKTCPQCGPNDALVSTDAATWQAKRDLWGYVPVDVQACTLHCDRCKIDHKPNMVFLDVTNRCNMNCPICIATIRGMGFEFTPPLEYFEKVFAHISQFDPKPMVELFGGEPTMHPDLVSIIALGRKYGLKPRVVTNGLKLADPDYCKALCDSRVRFRFAFDGHNADIYEKLRHNRAAYDKKLKALENLDRFSRRRHAIISCAAWGFNDQYIPGLLQYCHDHRDLISDLGIIPLTENWEEGAFEVETRTTLEDVEKMMAQSVVGGGVEFVPAGLSYTLRIPRPFFRRNTRSEVLLLAGVHPNCESMTLLISDGKQFRSIAWVLRKPFSQVCAEIVEITKKIEPKLDALDPNRFWQRLRGKMACVRHYAPYLAKRVRWGRLLANLIRGEINNLRTRSKRLAGREGDARKRRPSYLFRAAVLPFEEQHSVDAARMENCKAVFAFEDTASGKVETIPACLWYPYRNERLEKLSAKYGTTSKPADRAGDAENVPAQAEA